MYKRISSILIPLPRFRLWLCLYASVLTLGHDVRHNAPAWYMYRLVTGAQRGARTLQQTVAILRYFAQNLARRQSDFSNGGFQHTT